MQIGAKYSHMHGEEHLIVHQSELWREVQDVIAEVDAQACRTNPSHERGRDRQLYSPINMSEAFDAGFSQRGWLEESLALGLTSDEEVPQRDTDDLPEKPTTVVEKTGQGSIATYSQTDFVKSRVGVEVRLAEYSSIAHDCFVARHLSAFVSDVIDVGIEILPMKALGVSMLSAAPNYERDLRNLLRQGRGVPAVPLVLIGVKP